MKKAIAIFSALSLSLSIHAQQWNGPLTSTDLIYRNGNVIIGNSSGPSTLSVGGDLRIGADNSLQITSGNSPRLLFGHYLSGRIPTTVLSYFTMQYLNDDGNGTVLPVNPGLYVYPSHSVQNLDGSIPEQSKVFYFSSYGRLGIGTNTINGSNQDGYRLFVKDGIRTEKVKVDIAASNGWADYVFKKDYPLMPLGELEHFISKNGHLPEVPTTEEAIQNGIELKQMNILLLKKIEELTLHAIEQQKNIEKQNKRIERLEKNIKVH